jgi:hypothetical protein
MTLVDIGITLFLVIILLTGLFVIIRSIYINNRIFDWSARLIKSCGNIPNSQGQRATSLWIIRLFSFFIMIVCMLALYFLLTNIRW